MSEKKELPPLTAEAFDAMMDEIQAGRSCGKAAINTGTNGTCMSALALADGKVWVKIAA